MRLIPPPYEHETCEPCEQLPELESELIDSWRTFDPDERLKIKHRVDLNNDGTCELLTLPPLHAMGSGGPWLEIWIAKDGRYEHIGGTVMGSDGYALASSKNGFARIWNCPNVNNKPNPIWLAHVYAFNGEEYELEYACPVSHGQMMDWGLECYREGRYGDAEIWYENAYRMYRGQLSDANNLALVYIRLGRLEDAIELLAPYREREPDRMLSAGDLANAMYNLGKAHEIRSDFGQALEDYTAAAALEPNDARVAAREQMAARVK